MLPGIDIAIDTLKRRDFGRWTAGASLALVGLWAHRTANAWLAWELSRSVFWVGLIAFADLVPTLLISPLAGVYADRYDRLTILRAMQCIGLLASLTLVLLLVTGVLTLEILALLAFVQGTTAAVKAPARMALVRGLVPREALQAAIAISAVIFNFGRFAGPAVAGLLIVHGAVWTVYLFEAATSALFIGILLGLRVPFAPKKGARHGRSAKGGAAGVFADLAAGVRAIGRHRGIARLMVLMLAAGLTIRGVLELLSGYSSVVLERGPEGLAVLSACIGLAAVGTGIFMAGREGVAHLTRWTYGCLLAASVVAVALPFAPDLWVAAGLITIFGGAMSVTSISTQTLVQRNAPEEYLARIMAVYGVIFRGGLAVGALIMGAAADLFGFAWPMILGALLCAGAVMATVSNFPRLEASLEAEPVEGRPA